MTKRGLLAVYSIIYVLMIVGCMRFAGDNNEEEFREMEAISENVSEDFRKNPNEAKELYLEYWQSVILKADRSVADEVKMLVVARELMARDKQNYEKYYGYIESRLESDDLFVRSTAVDALSAAVGRESIDKLIHYAETATGETAIVALYALEHRLFHSKYDLDLEADYRYTERKLNGICLRRSRQLIAQFCDRLKAGRTLPDDGG
ncbi:hypothetical protein QFW77_04975 [Luteimonas sp. RD2P54]|uniref:HEAT repeat domain-containing protein n=1 Tax=Luteimonas endophytica TaxID=3042023 RepID=A0ABT6J684_9GAMM|nr:hypothetical protein [Luteimonas endophytica]MDH5822344.1 hypothetical protein [Luteimonas endophytica]